MGCGHMRRMRNLPVVRSFCRSVRGPYSKCAYLHRGEREPLYDELTANGVGAFDANRNNGCGIKRRDNNDDKNDNDSRRRRSHSLSHSRWSKWTCLFSCLSTTHVDCWYVGERSRAPFQYHSPFVCEERERSVASFYVAKRRRRNIWR